MERPVGAQHVGLFVPLHAYCLYFFCSAITVPRPFLIRVSWPLNRPLSKRFLPLMLAGTETATGPGQRANIQDISGATRCRSGS